METNGFGAGAVEASACAVGIAPLPRVMRSLLFVPTEI